MQLSVIIVSYNAAPFLALCLQSVLKASADISSEIIVVDNHSTDGTCDMVSSDFKSVKLIKNEDNSGFAKANNLGVSKAKGQYVLILNPDTVVAEDTFTSCLQFAESHSDLGALGVKLIDGTGHFLPESKRNLPTPKSVFNKIFGFKSNAHTYYANHINENAIEKVSILVGAFMFLKRETYLKVGGFDPDYFMYGEDIDLSYKLLKSGFQNYYLGNLSVLHFKGESTQKDVKYLKHFFRAMPLFYKKHFNSPLIFGWFLKLGMVFWFLIKYFQLKFTQQKHLYGNKALYLGKNSDLLSALKTKFKNLEWCQTSDKNKLTDFDLLFVDLASISFKHLLALLEQYKNLAHRFRIIFPNSKMILGSDSASDKGIVQSLN